MKTPFVFLFYVLFLGRIVPTQATSATCSCPEPRANQISASSFGITLLSPSFSSRYLNVTPDLGLVIKNPSEPIWFSSTKYYWDHGYYKAEGSTHSSVCTYRISYYNKELRKVRRAPGPQELSKRSTLQVKYANGDRPANITFGCHWYQECCDLGCCTSGILQVVIYIVLYLGVGMMLMGFCAQLPGETEEERRIRRARVDAGLFCPRGTRTQEPEPVEEQALREIVHQEAPPKYDDLYPAVEPAVVVSTQPSEESSEAAAIAEATE